MSQEESSVTPAAAAAAPDPETPKTEQITLARLTDVKRAKVICSVLICF